MNSTNRVANRLLLGTVGVLLVAAGALGIALGVVPGVASGWRAGARSALAGVPPWLGVPRIGDASAATIGTAALALVLAVLLVVFIVRQGRGHTGRVFTRRAVDGGTTLVEFGVPKALLEAHFAERPEFVSTRISAYRVRKTPMLKVSVRCRRGLPPTEASRIVRDALLGLDAVLGVSIPALVQVTGGFRVRGGKEPRVA